MLRFAKKGLISGTLLMALSFPLCSQTEGFSLGNDGGENSQSSVAVYVSVYDDAGVPAPVLAQAEREAGKIYDRAGLNLIWANCPTRNHRAQDALAHAAGQSSPTVVPLPFPLTRIALRPGIAFRPGLGLDASLVFDGTAARVGTPAPAWTGTVAASSCGQFDWPTHLGVRLVAQSYRVRNDVFGMAFLSPEGTGCYSNVYYDRTVALRSDQNVSVAAILGNVIAHELGHLLLGSNSHAPAGIMRARWKDKELRGAAMGTLLFTPDQAENMRGKLRAASRGLTVAARQSH